MGKEDRLLVLISGRARAGKDTTGIYLKKYFKGAKLMAYSDPLKKDLMSNLGLTYQQLYGDLKEVPDIRYPKPNGDGYWTPRQMMQAYGQFMRSLDTNYWVNKLFAEIEKKCYNEVIITDGRQSNEVDAVSSRGGYHIRITRPGDNAITGKDHETEVALDKEDYVTHYKIDNNGTLQDLYLKLDYVIKDIMSKYSKTKEVYNGY